MLYDLWRQVARERGSDLALQDFASGRCWTFRELAAEADSRSRRGNEAEIAFPQGSGAEFILNVLHAWREDQIVCPLEPGQPPPSLNSASVRARPIVHIKTTSATAGEPRLITFTAEQLAADAE